MAIKKTQFDDRGVFEKAASGDFKAMDGYDAATIGQVVAGTAGLFEKTIPYAKPAGAVLSGVSAYYDDKKQCEKIAHYFEGESILGVRQKLAHQNSALRKRLETEVDWLNFGGQAAASIGGSAAGAVAGTALGSAAILAFSPLAPVAFAFMPAGALAGGYVGSSIYNAICVKQEQDPVIINMQICKMREAGEYIPPEIVFAALAANLPNKDGKMVDKVCSKLTGTKLFTEALSNPDNIPKLGAMMNNQTIDNAIRAQTGMVCDPQNPYKTVAEQYAELINSGQMKPQNLFNTGEGLYITLAAAKGQHYNVDVPITPESRQNFIGRNV